MHLTPPPTAAPSPHLTVPSVGGLWRRRTPGAAERGAGRSTQESVALPSKDALCPHSSALGYAPDLCSPDHLDGSFILNGAGWKLPRHPSMNKDNEITPRTQAVPQDSHQQTAPRITKDSCKQDLLGGKVPEYRGWKTPHNVRGQSRLGNYVGQVGSPRWPTREENRTAYHGSQGAWDLRGAGGGVTRAGSGRLAAVHLTGW